MWFGCDVSYEQIFPQSAVGNCRYRIHQRERHLKDTHENEEQSLFPNARFAEYGNVNKIGASKFQPVLWSLTAWFKGVVGVLPWQTIGTKTSWGTGEQTALLYPQYGGPPLPSVRLKAIQRGQQGLEYLRLYCEAFHKPRFVAGEILKEVLGIEIGKAEFSKARDSDLELDYAEKLWKLRYLLGRELSEKAPPYKRSLSLSHKQPFDPKVIPNLSYTEFAPDAECCKPECAGFKPRTR